MVTTDQKSTVKVTRAALRAAGWGQVVLPKSQAFPRVQILGAPGRPRARVESSSLCGSQLAEHSCSEPCAPELTLVPRYLPGQSRAAQQNAEVVWVPATAPCPPGFPLTPTQDSQGAHSIFSRPAPRRAACHVLPVTAAGKSRRDLGWLMSPLCSESSNASQSQSQGQPWGLHWKPQLLSRPLPRSAPTTGAALWFLLQLSRLPPPPILSLTAI